MHVLGDSTATTVYWSEGSESQILLSLIPSSHMLRTHTQPHTALWFVWLFWATRTSLCAVVLSWPARPHLVVGVSCLGSGMHVWGTVSELAGPRMHVRRVQSPRAHNISFHPYLPTHRDERTLLRCSVIAQLPQCTGARVVRARSYFISSHHPTC